MELTLDMGAYFDNVSSIYDEMANLKRQNAILKIQNNDFCNAAVNMKIEKTVDNENNKKLKDELFITNTVKEKLMHELSETRHQLKQAQYCLKSTQESYQLEIRLSNEAFEEFEDKFDTTEDQNENLKLQNKNLLEELTNTKQNKMLVENENKQLKDDLKEISVEYIDRDDRVYNLQSQLLTALRQGSFELEFDETKPNMESTVKELRDSVKLWTCGKTGTQTTQLIGADVSCFIEDFSTCSIKPRKIVKFTFKKKKTKQNKCIGA